MFTELQKRIEAVCHRAGRDPAEITLVAVSKGHSAAEIEAAILRFGHRILGENRVQEWREKAKQLPNIDWHFIGNLQSNKVKHCTGFSLIHSLNSKRLATVMEEQGQKRNHCFRVMIEVNISGEASKHGLPPSDVAELLHYTQSLPHVEVCGLMTMAPYATNPESSRPIFRALRELRDKLQLKELSMGMSGDFEVAIEEGATYIRVGSALFNQGDKTPT